MTSRLTFVPLPDALRPPAYAEVEMIRFDGRSVGSIARIALDAHDVIERPWTWFVVEAGDFRAGRAVTADTCRAAARAALHAIRRREGIDP